MTKNKLLHRKSCKTNMIIQCPSYYIIKYYPILEAHPPKCSVSIYSVNHIKPKTPGRYMQPYF